MISVDALGHKISDFLLSFSYGGFRPPRLWEWDLTRGRWEVANSVDRSYPLKGKIIESIDDFFVDLDKKSL
jgi:hypothetical protein